jgi:N-acyl-D-aspartate/D-glutamate deacylase
MTVVLCEFEARVAECAATDHQWNGREITVHGITLELVVCGNCGITATQATRDIYRALSAPAPLAA